MFSQGGRMGGQPRMGAARGDTFEVSEFLAPLDRARHFGTSKHSLQRLVCVQELVDCARDVGYDQAATHLLPLVRALSQDPELLVRQSLVGRFADLAAYFVQEDPERGYQKVADDLLPVVTRLLTEKASEVRTGAAEALALLASHLKPGERDDRVLMAVIQLSHSNDDEAARTMAVTLLSQLAETLGEDLCQQFVGMQLIALCEDPAFRVRKATAANLHEVSKVVPDEWVLKKVVPTFARLVHDQHWGVRKAAAEGLVELAMAMQAEHRAEPFVPLMTDLLNDQSKWVKMTALQQLGGFIAALGSRERTPPQLLEQYLAIVEQCRGSPDVADISCNCAFTFAAVCQTMGPESWETFQVPFSTLCRDFQPKTRKSMAASMHIVAQTVGPAATEQEVLPHFEALMQDTADDVRLAALKNADGILKGVRSEKAQRRIFKALQGALARSTTAGSEVGWRARHVVAGQLGAVCEAMATAEPAPDADGATPAAAQDLTWNCAVPLFVQLLADGCAEVRDEAAQQTARVLRAAAPELLDQSLGAASPDGSSGGAGSDEKEALPPQALRLARHLVKSFARSKSFRGRQTYIRMCDSVIRDSPPGACVEKLMKPLVRIATDRTKNVRLIWAAVMLPHLRPSGRLGQNPALVNAAKRMAAEDKDPEIMKVMQGATFKDLPEAEAGPESDDGSDSDAWIAPAEAGTGGSRDGSEVGIGETVGVDGAEDKAEAGAEEAASSSAPSPPRAAAPPPVVPKQIAHVDGVPMHDATEDGLFGSAEADAELDRLFPERRLVAQYEEQVGVKGKELERSTDGDDPLESLDSLDSFTGGPAPSSAGAVAAFTPPARAAEASAEASAAAPAPAAADAADESPAEAPADSAPVAAEAVEPTEPVVAPAAETAESAEAKAEVAESAEAKAEAVKAVADSEGGQL